MSEGKITREEMIEMFGSEMPIEAFQLMADAPPDWTLAQVRARLREIAAERPKSTRELVSRLRAMASADHPDLLSCVDRTTREMNRDVREAADLIEHLTTLDGWRDIESAPKESAIIDLWVTTEGGLSYRHTNCMWSGSAWLDDEDCELEDFERATHWRLPPPPPVDLQQGIK